MKSLVVCLVGLLVSVQASPVSPPVISGQVRLSAGSPVAGAQVVLFDVADLGRGPVGQATTDEAGQFALPLAASAALVLPQGFALGPNYPNPFNPSTIIPYQLSAPSPVRLEVFNILGQHMATLVDEEQAAGSYRARWDGTDAAGGAAASGVYFYRLTVAGAHQTGRMVLVDGQVGVPAGGPRVAAVPLAAGSTGTYGLVVSGEGLVAYVDAAFSVAVGQGPVTLEVTEPLGREKAVVPTLAGRLGDVNNNGRVDLDDGLLVAMHRVDPSLSLPNHGQIGLGDVNCNGRVDRTDAELLATFVVHPSAAAVSSRRIGQRGGYSLDPVTELVWGSILGTEQQDATVARLLDEVPVLVSGVFDIDGRDHLYLGIDHDYYQRHGGEHLYDALKERFPITPLFVEASDGIQREPVPERPSAKRATDEPEEGMEDEPMGEDTEASDDDSDFDDLFSLFGALDDETEGPDLAVTLTTASPASVQSGETVTVRGHVANLGTADAPSANVHVYRHTATTTDPRRVGTRETNATVTGTLLVPSASVPVEVENTAPAVSATTTYYYYVCVDAADGEQQVHNNCSATPANVTVQSDSDTPDEGLPATPEDEPTETPDLAIPSVTASPTNPASQGLITLQITVHNSGAGSASSEIIRVYLHAARTANPTVNGTRIVQTVRSGSLAAGASATLSLSTVVPSVPSATTYYYYACVDAAAGEQQTGNNCSLDPAEVRVGGGGSVAVGVGSGLILSLSATPDITESGTQVAVRVIVRNDGTASAGSETIHLYRHRTRTSNPTSGGSRLATTATTGSLAAGAQVTKTIVAAVPSVTSDTIYYYYACVTAADGETVTDDNCAGPAEVRVSKKGEKVPTNICERPIRRTPMGGDSLSLQHFNGTSTPCSGTITLGGIETTDGTRGFVVSAHTVDASRIHSNLSPDSIDMFVGHTGHKTTLKLQHLLGKLLTIPSRRTEGGKEIVAVDAAFVKYPQPQRPNCSIPWEGDGEAFCLDDTNQGDYIDRLSPLTIRGKNGDVYRVIGSKQPTAGLKITYSGVVSGPHGKEGSVAGGGKALVHYGYGDAYQYVYKTTSNLGTVSGDSGGPIYTIPDANKNTYIVGVHKGTLWINRKPVGNFSSWDDVTDALNLKPITQ